MDLPITSVPFGMEQTAIMERTSDGKVLQASVTGRTRLAISVWRSDRQSIATQLSAPQITAHKAMVKMSINLCSLVRSTLGSSICAKWSAIVIFSLSFTPSLGNIATFTMTLPSQPHCSTSIPECDRYLFSDFSIYVLYLDAFALGASAS